MAFGYDTIANGASISMPAFFMYFGALGPTGYYLPSTVRSSQDKTYSRYKRRLIYVVDRTLDRDVRTYASNRSFLCRLPPWSCREKVASFCVWIYYHDWNSYPIHVPWKGATTYRQNGDRCWNWGGDGLRDKLCVWGMISHPSSSTFRMSVLTNFRSLPSSFEDQFSRHLCYLLFSCKVLLSALFEFLFQTSKSKHFELCSQYNGQLELW